MFRRPWDKPIQFRAPRSNRSVIFLKSLGDAAAWGPIRMQSLGGVPDQAAFPQGNIGIDAAILLAVCVVLLGVASLRLRRRTP